MVDKERAELMNLRKRVELQRIELKRLQSELADCRNELCLLCGQYKQRHLGACEGCRWNG